MIKFNEALKKFCHDEREVQLHQCDGHAFIHTYGRYNKTMLIKI